MSDHVFDQTTRRCDGCNLAMSELVDKEGMRRRGKLLFPAISVCPAFRCGFSDGETLVSVIITPDEELIVRRDRVQLKLTEAGMFSLREAIEFGVRQIREAKGE